MSPVPVSAAPSVRLKGGDGPGRPALRALSHTWQGRIGVLLCVIMLGLIVLGPHFAPYDPTALAVGPPLSPPSAEFPLGTDNLGRDVLSRVLFGGTLILFVPIAAVALAAVLGGLPGMLGAYSGGKWDSLISRSFDLFLTLPPLLIALSVIAGFGSSTSVLIITVGLIYAPQIGRIARGATMGVITSDYILAARARGERPLTILLREVTPNITGPMVSDLALRLTYAVIFVSTLNFLGLGAQPPSPDWGLSIATNLGFISVQPYATLAPAAGIALLSVAFNLVADSVAKAVANDPGGEAML
jgi:peptide/nickel transport system permease protein